MQLDRKQVNNQLYNIWESFRRPNYINARILVFYKEGRGVLNSFCDRDVLQLRGGQENERGFKSDLAKQTIKRFGLTETAGSGRHRSVTPDARFKPPKRLIKRVPKSRERGSSFIDGRRVSRRGTTSGPVENAASDHSPEPSAHKVRKQSIYLVQQKHQGEKDPSSAATSTALIPRAQTHTFIDGDAEIANFVRAQNPSPLSSELTASESTGRGQRQLDFASSPVAPSHSPATPPLNANAFDSIRVAGAYPHFRRAPSSSESMGKLVSAPAPESRVPEFLQKISDFACSDRRRYLPNHKNLKNLGVAVSKCIATAVYDLLRATNTDPNKVPPVLLHTGEPQFFEFCKRIYEANSTVALIDRVVMIEIRSQLLLGQFLRSIIAAGVYDWVLQGQQDSLPPGFPEKTEYAQLLERVIHDHSPEYLDRLVCKVKFDWAQAPQQNSREIEDYPKTLSDRLLYAILPFLKATLTHSSPSNLVSFQEKLGEVFSEALTLSRQRSIQAEELSFRWVFANNLFDPKFMKAEEARSITHGSKVQLCLSPALIERKKAQSKSESPKDTVIYQALVSLQSSAGSQ